jgi:hypothetical protein
MVDGTLRLSFERHARRSFAIKRQKRCHQKAKVSPLDLTMSKSPKRPSQLEPPSGLSDGCAGTTPRRAPNLLIK